MFNHSSNVSVTVKDEVSTVKAADLLHKLEKEAHDKIVKAFKFDNNEFKMSCAKLWDLAHIGPAFQIIYTLNNKTYDLVVRLDEMKFMQMIDPKGSMLREVVTNIATSIVENHMLETPDLLKMFFT